MVRATHVDAQEVDVTVPEEISPSSMARRRGAQEAPTPQTVDREQEAENGPRLVRRGTEPEEAPAPQSMDREQEDPMTAAWEEWLNGSRWYLPLCMHTCICPGQIGDCMPVQHECCIANVMLLPVPPFMPVAFCWCFRYSRKDAPAGDYSELGRPRRGEAKNCPDAGTCGPMLLYNCLTAKPGTSDIRPPPCCLWMVRKFPEWYESSRPPPVAVSDGSGDQGRGRR